MDTATPAYVAEWVKRLSEPQDAFRGFPSCPFAKTAHLICMDCRDTEAARECLLSLELRRSVLVINLPLDLSEEAHALAAELNPDLKARGLFALVSDPNRPVVVRGHRTTQADRLFLIVQPYEELQRAAELLQAHGYYRYWDAETLNRIREGRE